MALGVFLVVAVATYLFLKYLSSLDPYKRDKRTRGMIPVGIVAGIISAPLSLGLYWLNPLTPLEYHMSELAYNFLVVGLNEEIAKYGMFIAMVLTFRSIKEPQDGIVQGAAVGLGFQATEDILYGLSFGLEVAIWRTIMLGLHMVSGALWGYAFSYAFYANLEERNERAVGYALLAVIPAAFCHGLYNVTIGIGSLTGIPPALETVIVLIMLFAAVRAFRRMAARSPYRLYPFSRYREAIPNIRRGLLLNPTSLLLNRRMALYLLAAGNYRKALGHIRMCKKRVKKKTMYEALEGVAMLGIARQGRSTEYLQAQATAQEHLVTARKKLNQEGRTMSLVNQLPRFIRDEALLDEVRVLLTPPKLRTDASVALGEPPGP
jgi:RsiW-degrading membrane proteinase PrsW (M82 family)